VRGVVQGVGFRPHVYRLARARGLCGWIVNDGDGVEIHVEGGEAPLDAFVAELTALAPPAALVSGVHVTRVPVAACRSFEIRASRFAVDPTVRIAPDLPTCAACLRDLFHPADRRSGYAYINCTDCGPRFSIVLALPYDRARTTMAGWRMCVACAGEYGDPEDRRFHAQPVACPACGPQYTLVPTAGAGSWAVEGDGPLASGAQAIAAAARLLRDGGIVAVKGIGGYHLACNAADPTAIEALRDRKFRKEQPFAVMVRDAGIAHATCELTPAAEALLGSAARPIVLAAQRVVLPGVAPDRIELGVMLPYAPVHHLLFAHGAPERLVMTSGNRSSEPIAFDDADARSRLSGLADAFLTGERPIARRVDDSIVRAGVLGPVVLRRSRGLAPHAVASLPADRPVLALGGDLKNAITLVAGGQAYVSQHIGDLTHHEARVAFRSTIDDLMEMYCVNWDDVLVVHDPHPEYASTRCAAELPARQRLAVQHHRAHVASVLAEHDALDLTVVGVALDGSGYGDDGSIWGGELFVGSVRAGFERVAHVTPALLPGGDAAARHPVQAAAGFIERLDAPPDLSGPPFAFPDRYRHARALVRAGVRAFPTTSAGRLFDTVAALSGFTRPVTFEGQAAGWIEHLGRRAGTARTDVAYPMPFHDGEIDWRAALAAIIDDRLAGVDPALIARAFHRGFAHGLATAIRRLLDTHRLETVALSGGVLQNDLLLGDLCDALGATGPRILINHLVPPNDGGLSLGQASLAAVMMC
jgi:hydrogenase maturation protein HypF